MVTSSSQTIRIALKYKTPTFKISSIKPYVLSSANQSTGDLPIKKHGGSILASISRGVLSLNGSLLEGGDYYLKHLKKEATWMIDGQMYIGDLHIKIRSNKEMCLILHCDLERYVASVVAGESGPFFCAEALKCQAVAARTFAMFRKLKEPRSRSLFDVFPDTRDQMFKGLSSVRSKHIMATNLTHHQVLNWQGKLLGAFYHSSCGGHTVNAMDMNFVLKETAPLTGRPCHWCQDSSLYLWKHPVSIFEFANKVPELKNKIINNIDLKKQSAGHVSEVVVMTNKGNVKLSSYKFRKAIGFKVMRSSRFECKIHNQQIHITGHGFGHGVGMCQYGSDAMGKAGKTYKQIMQYYFPGSSIDLISTST